MKAILVVDTPKDCGHCLLSDFVDGDNCLCRRVDRKSKSNEKPSWCPLKPLPEIKYISLNDKHDDLIFQMGWNACLEEIEGETE